MKNNKLLMIMLILLVAITLVGAVALVVVLKVNGESEHKEPSIEEVLEASVDVPEITTNLQGNDFIKISFKIETDSKKAKEELEKRDFQVKNIIIQELSERESEELQGKDGKIGLEETLKEKINSLMLEGKVKKVYITQSLLQ
ncbi:flagellar basal body-associated protein FliL [Bacillus canaveralius]|uniref:Flagellar protein FliL n=1 Tax=Bacillus canaveralius TaxID=1403243 RepID=A0A2N5GP24_9BACI|nr:MULTISPECIES: flagellar basal body-associated protein FliL [Bacillus]PLR84220.1 flagellar basal body-associated protein FliL [Bacillus canaveralius]PLR87461.1 flagellar basal body-associated protein FliL [Bacillus sp. V33-4]PLR89399.1 flagellar basal body-associated protein FliL [Bacillus canaveralius]RSK45124.1 flagellar basal body-associated protein FliL [Bacillus canaveralius]